MDEDMAHSASGESGQPQTGNGWGSLGRGSEATGLRELSLFTGAGGGLLGSMLLGFRTVAAVEIDPYCQRVLCARGGYMADAESVFGDGGDDDGVADSGPSVPKPRDGSGPPRAFPIYSDVRTFHPVPGSCDIVTGGFPCQPFSQAGKRLGEDDPRNMWPQLVRVLRESGASLGFFENVPGLLSAHSHLCPDCRNTLEFVAVDPAADPWEFPLPEELDGLYLGLEWWYWCECCETLMDHAAAIPDYYFGTVLGDLAEAGFDAEWCVLGADDVGAPHRRKRLWILAYRDGASTRVRPGAVAEAERGSGRDAALDLLAGRGEVSGGSAELSDAESVDVSWSVRSRDSGRRSEASSGNCGCSPWAIDPADVGHADAAGSQGHGLDGERCGQCPDREPESRLGVLAPGLARGLGRCVPRVAVGVPERVNRLRALGNGQVPQCMAAAFTLLARQAGVVTS